MIISKLLPEFEFESNLCRKLYANPRFLELREEYKERYGQYPVDLVEKYNRQVHFEPQMLFFESMGTDYSNGEEFEAAIKDGKVWERNNTLAKVAMDSFIEELEEILAGGLGGTNHFLAHGDGGTEEGEEGGSQKGDAKE